MFLSVLTFVIIMLVLLIPGFVLRKFNLLKRENCSGLSALLLYVCSPLLIFKSLLYDPTKIENPTDSNLLIGIAIIFAVAFVAIFIVFFIAKLIFLKNSDRKAANAQIFASVFGNVAFIGIPFIAYILKSDPLLPYALVYGAIFNIVFNVLCWTLGIYIITGSFKSLSIKRILLNPIIIVSAIALPLFFLKINFYSILPPLVDILSFLGNMTTPLSMIIVGIRLADVNVKTIFASGWVYLGSLTRLIIAPLLAFGIVMGLKSLGLFGWEGSAFYNTYGKSICTVLCVLTALPCAASTIAFCESFDGDSLSAVKVFMNSTFLSLITLPLLLSFMLLFL